MSANIETVVHEEAARPATARRRGRPLEMTPQEVLARIRHLAGNGSLFRVHRDHPGLYARARRQFGSWAGAVANAGLDYTGALGAARRRSVATRRGRRAAGEPAR